MRLFLFFWKRFDGTLQAVSSKNIKTRVSGRFEHDKRQKTTEVHTEEEEFILIQFKFKIKTFRGENMASIFEIILNAMMIGLGSGIGSAVGVYFANKTIIKNLEMMEKIVNKFKEKNKKNK
jgi:uncharacterized membrane protein